MTDREVIKLEANIRAKMEGIKTGKFSVKDSGIGVLINNLKKADEAAYEKMMVAYKALLQQMK
ncbi:MAG: hypothetical protein ACK57K_12290 [Chryseotalea sp.]|jgi:hypothetical protein|nr:hypothetical protein [Flammeovirgaceae bacterium]